MRKENGIAMTGCICNKTYFKRVWDPWSEYVVMFITCSRNISQAYTMTAEKDDKGG